MKISELLKPSLIKMSLQADNKDELFPEMVQLFVSSGLIKDRVTAIRILEEREAKMSTGIANGLGLPHGKLPEAKQTLLAMGISKSGIEYDSLDGELVYIVITIFAELENPGQHIQVLAEISRLFSIPGFKERLQAAATPAEVLDIIRSEE
jgi:mannitol/fructose-specific phosphotransferase system IIA component (Ntr-type)